MFAFLSFLLCIRVVHLILKSANLIFVIMLNEITHQFLRLSCKGVLILLVPLSRRVILFCDIQVTKFSFPLFRRRICRNKVILGILKNGVLGVLPKFCTFQKLDYFILSQVHILRLAIFQ